MTNDEFGMKLTIMRAGIELDSMNLPEPERKKLLELADRTAKRHAEIQQAAEEGRKAAKQLGDALRELRIAMVTISGVVADASIALAYKQFDAEARAREAEKESEG